MVRKLPPSLSHVPRTFSTGLRRKARELGPARSTFRILRKLSPSFSYVTGIARLLKTSPILRLVGPGASAFSEHLVSVLGFSSRFLVSSSDSVIVLGTRCSSSRSQSSFLSSFLSSVSDSVPTLGTPSQCCGSCRRAPPMSPESSGYPGLTLRYPVVTPHPALSDLAFSAFVVFPPLSVVVVAFISLFIPFSGSTSASVVALAPFFVLDPRLRPCPCPQTQFSPSEHLSNSAERNSELEPSRRGMYCHKRVF